MTKAQALALANALEARSVPYDVLLRFDGAGVPSWAVQLDPTHTLFGPDLAALATYCANNGLTVSATFSALGII